ncbi:hypothetical protein [Paracoccus xiamenensis]|uniref:hypothetical protein n=1 Tax=Paracoccus xiamenensis TaxID=2714901 RepID=UPI0014094F9A|nr:hypothetical protein [Paracoccus xiamenensis]NHF71935.1 hypothetical protein [Paracoccus xiamenensis]
MTFSRSRLTFAAVALTAVLGLGACATSVPPSESYAATSLLNDAAKQSLKARVNAYDAELRRGNLGATIDYLPPRLAAVFAEKSGISAQQAKANMDARVAGTRSEIRIAGGHDLSQALVGTAGNGMPYAVIPAAARATAGGLSLTEQGNTLAVLDGGTWYLAALTDDEAIAEIRQAYPEFRRVALPASQTMQSTAAP